MDEKSEDMEMLENLDLLLDMALLESEDDFADMANIDMNNTEENTNE